MLYIDGAVLKSRKRKKPTFQEMQKEKILSAVLHILIVNLTGFKYL